MKNSLSDLNNHLFAQLERLGDEGIEGDALDKEAKRSEAMVSVADQIIRNAALQIQAAKIAYDAGVSPVGYLPAPAIKAGETPHLIQTKPAAPSTPRTFPIKVGERAP